MELLDYIDKSLPNPSICWPYIIMARCYFGDATHNIYCEFLHLQLIAGGGQTPRHFHISISSPELENDLLLFHFHVWVIFIFYYLWTKLKYICNNCVGFLWMHLMNSLTKIFFGWNKCSPTAPIRWRWDYDKFSNNI